MVTSKIQLGGIHQKIAPDSHELLWPGVVLLPRLTPDNPAGVNRL